MIFLNKIKSIAKYRGLNIDPPEKKKYLHRCNYLHHILEPI